MKIKTQDLIGDALDWAVATCDGYTNLHRIEGRMTHEPQFAMLPPAKDYGPVEMWELSYSTDWARGGAILQLGQINLTTIHDGRGKWGAYLDDGNGHESLQTGDTQLIAAMRCYVASKLGLEVEVPDILMRGHIKHVVWFGDMENIKFTVGSDSFDAVIVHSIRLIKRMTEQEAEDYMGAHGYDMYLMPEVYKGEILYSNRAKRTEQRTRKEI